nr:hypothetical protein BgiMline_017635 [Biomphalaria glabrata]
MANIFLVLYMVYVSLHLTGSQQFQCSRPDYDKLQPTDVGVCVYNMCVHCISKTTYQEINYTLAVKINKLTTEAHDRSSRQKLTTDDHEKSSRQKLTTEAHDRSSRQTITKKAHDRSSRQKLTTEAHDRRSRKKLTTEAHDRSSRKKLTTEAHDRSSRQKLTTEAHDRRSRKKLTTEAHDRSSRKKLTTEAHDRSSRKKLTTEAHDRRSRKKLTTEAHDRSSRQKLTTEAHDRRSRKKLTTEAHDRSSRKKLTTEAHEKSSRQKLTTEAHEKSSRQRLTKKAHDRSSRQTITKKAHDRSSRQKLTTEAHDRSSQQTITKKAHEKSSRQKLTTEAHDRSSQQTITKKAHDRSSRQTITKKAHDRSSRQKLTTEAHNRRSRKKLTKKAHDRSSRKKLTTEAHDRSSRPRLPETVWTLDKDNALYLTQDNLTRITFPFNDSLGFSLFDGPVQFQFSMSALEEDGNVTNETNPWTAPERFSSQQFQCSRPDYDKLQPKDLGVCLYNMCVHCISKTTYQEINYTLAVKINETVWTLDKDNAIYSTQDNLTQITFPFNDSLGFSLLDGPVQFQFSMSALEGDGNVTNETNPCTTSEQFKTPDFICGSPDYDRSQTPRYEMCRQYLCVQCVSNVTYQLINATLGFLVQDKVGYSYKNLTFFRTEVNQTTITFQFMDELMEILAYGYQIQYQFSMSVLDNVGRRRKEISPLSEHMKYDKPTEIYFTINGKNDSVVEVTGDMLSFRCTSNGFPAPVLYLDSTQFIIANLFDNSLISPGIPVNISIHDRLASGSFTCYYSSQFEDRVEKRMFVLNHSQLRLTSNKDVDKDIDIQSVGSLHFLTDYSSSFDVAGYPAPNSILLSSNGIDITDGVDLTYTVYFEKYVFGYISVNFTDHSLLKKSSNYSLTVNNGRVAIFTFSCADCKDVISKSCTPRTSLVCITSFLLFTRLLSY